MNTDDQTSLEDLKKSGYILQRDGIHFTIRLRLPAGEVTSTQLKAVADASERYGRGELHITTRQGIQIPWVEFEDLGPATKALERIDAPPGSCGPRVRNISSCVGFPRCPNANVNTLELSRKIDELFFDSVLPGKLKIAVSGCPNSCAKPQVNDIGLVGVVRPRINSELCDDCGKCVRACKEAAITLSDGKAEIDYSRCISCGECVRACPIEANVEEETGYSIYLGGNVGRHPRLAHKILSYAEEEEVLRIIAASTRVFKAKAERKERFGALIERIGLGDFLKELFEYSGGGDDGSLD